MAKLISVVVLAFFLAAGMPVHGEEALSIDPAPGEPAGAGGDGQQAVKSEKKPKKGKKMKKNKKNKKGKKGKKPKKGKKNKKPKKEKAAAEQPAEDNASEWVQPEGSAQ